MVIEKRERKRERKKREKRRRKQMDNYSRRRTRLEIVKIATVVVILVAGIY